MGDSDSEFERFLQDDDESSMSASPVRAPPKAKRAPASSAASASAITSAAAALLASSKLTGKLGKGAKSDAKKSKKSKSKKSRELSDSEEPPPSYDAAHSGYSGDTDPYAFELRAPSFHAETEEKEHKSKKVEKRKIKPEVTKKAPRSVLSIEDRVAEILKRTGSSITPASVEEKEEEPQEPTTGPKVAEASHEVPLPHHANDTTRASGDSSKLSASDSLGMESADFEVGAYARRKLEFSRLSLSSLNSEKFSMNVAALEDSEQTPSRYQQPNDGSTMSPDRSVLGDSNYSEKNGYDDDFELDQTTIGDIPGLQHPVRDIPTDPIDARKNKDVLSGSEESLSALSPIRNTETFGYDDDDFEEEGAAQTKGQESELDPQLRVQTTVSAENEDSTGYEDEAFESQDQDTAADGSDMHSPRITEPASVDKTDFAALLAEKYGDFYAITEEKELLTTDVNPTATASIDVLVKPIERYSDHDAPMSPPPPPPPDDDEYDNELHTFALNADNPSYIALDVPTTIADPRADLIVSEADAVKSTQPKQSVKTSTTNTIEPPPVPDIVGVNTDNLVHDLDVEPSKLPTEGYPTNICNPPIKTVDTSRFNQIESRVASLRLLSQSSTLQHSSSASQDRSPPKAASTESFPIPELPDLEILFDDMEDIDEFIRQSQTLRAKRHSPARARSSHTKELELALQLQRAQRQIVLLKNHIESIDETDSPRKLRASSFLGIPSVSDDKEPLRDQENVIVDNKPDDYNSRKVSMAKYRKLQAEFATQEKLIEAFQKENEKLMQQLRHAREGAKGDLLAENDALRRELKEAKLQLESGVGKIDPADGGTMHWQLRAAIDARLHAEAKALALQEELIALQREHSQKQSELRLELDRMKKAKLDLECRYEGVDLVKLAQETNQVKLLQDELKLKKKEYYHNLGALQKKLEWYVENQRLVDAQDDELLRFKKEVRLLKSEVELLRSEDLIRRVRASSAPSPSPAKVLQKKAHNRSPADIRRIQELETRLIEIEAAMRKRHPDSLVNLIVASKKIDEESKIAAMEAEFESKIRALEEELASAHEAHENKMKSFRQQQDRLVLQYQRRIREQDIRLTERNKPSAASGRVASKNNRQTNNEGTVHAADHIRQFYTEKIKELERKWEAKYRALKKHLSSNPAQNANQFPGRNGSSPDIEELRSKLEMKEEELQQLRVQLSRRKSFEDENQLDEHHWREHIHELEMQLRASEDAREQLVKTLVTLQNAATTGQPSISAPSSGVYAQTGLQIPQIREELRKELVEKLQKEHAVKTVLLETQLATSTNESKARIEELKAMCERLEGQVDHLKSENDQLQKRLSMSDGLCKKLQESADRVPTLEYELLTLRHREKIPLTPSMMQYRKLELKIETLTQKHEMREAELRVLLEQAMMSSHLERLNLERVHRSAVAAKNAEIAVFKQQLGEILDELARLEPRVEGKTKQNKQLVSS